MNAVRAQGWRRFPIPAAVHKVPYSHNFRLHYLHVNTQGSRLLFIAWFESAFVSATMNSDRGSQSYAPRRRSPTVPSSTNPRKRPAESQEEAWVADEDRFVLQQAKKKAKIRAHAGRAQPIDLLAVTLRTLDPTPDDQEDDVNDGEPMLVDPEGVFESMDESQLRELEKGIDTYLALEKSRFNKDFWNVCTPAQLPIMCRN